MAKQVSKRRRDHSSLHNRKAQAWVRKHLSDKYEVHPSKLKMTDSLKDWGFDDEKSLAELAGDFNRETRRQRLWQDADVAPPHLIANVKGKTVQDLASFLSSETAKNVPALATAPTKETIQKWLIVKLGRVQFDPPVKANSKFGPYPDIALTPTDTLDLEDKFAQQFGPCDDILAQALGHTVAQTAQSLCDYVKANG